MIDIDEIMERKEKLTPTYHSGPFYEIEHKDFDEGSVIVSSGNEHMNYEIAQIDHRGKRRVKAQAGTKKLAMAIGSIILWMSEK